MPEIAEGPAPRVLWKKIINYKGKKSIFSSKGVIIPHLDHGNTNDLNG